jgi:hypothetical protein
MTLFVVCYVNNTNETPKGGGTPSAGGAADTANPGVQTAGSKYTGTADRR